jgi:hypothetical protein
VFQGTNNKKEKKKNHSGEDDLTYGPRDYVIGKSSSNKLYLLFLRENSTNSCGGQDQGRNFGYGLLLSRLSSGNYGPVCMEHPLFFGSLCNRECKVIVYSLFPN